MYINRLNMTIAESRDAERARADVIRQAAMIEYIAMMTDIELPMTDEAEEDDEQILQ
ncbi:MAG: hypothetical protein IJ072_01155 [Oscillospiraceae bacterium]|nr:hypothetical protein [Oscillospiraceae bacterium]